MHASASAVLLSLNTTTTEVPYGRNKPSIHLSRRMYVTAVV